MAHSDWWKAIVKKTIPSITSLFFAIASFLEVKRSKAYNPQYIPFTTSNTAFSVTR